MVIGLALPAGVVTDFSAASGSPAAQGWSSGGGILSGSLVDVDGAAVWEMTGNFCCGYWYSNLTVAQWTEAFEKGWSLSGNARIPEGAGIGYIDLDGPASRWDIVFGVTAGKNWVGLSNWFDYANPALKHTLPAGGFHNFDMRYDPDTKTAGLWVDGLIVLSGYKGHNQFPEAHGPIFGVTGSTTKAQFGSVRLSITEPEPPVPGTVPEPATWLTMAAGAIVLGLRRAR